MVLSTFNHIQGNNGSHWNRLMRGANAEKICIVAIDAAKFVNAAMICNVYGDILVKPFEFNASSTGFNRLVKEIKEAKEGYAFEEVVVGIETTGHYYEDLVRLCEQEKFIVRIINAATTAKERETVLNYTKTDNVDLMAITQSLLHGRGQTSQEALPLLEQLKTLSRAHRAMINAKSPTINHIRLYMDHIFREFQGIVENEGGKKKKLTIFSEIDSKASLYLMRHYPHPSDILSLGEEGLRRISMEHNLKMRCQSIERLMNFASKSVSKPKELLQAELFVLAIKLDELALMKKQINCLKSEMEDVLLQTDGGILLSIRGVAVTIASELTAEIGDLSLFTRPEQLIKMAGTNPVVRQSGGKRATTHQISKQGRADFRAAVYLAGKSMRVQNPAMKQKAEEMKVKGKKAGQIYIALGNRLLRLAFAMMKKQQVYQSGTGGKSLQAIIASKLVSKEKQALFFNRYVVN